MQGRAAQAKPECKTNGYALGDVPLGTSRANRAEEYRITATGTKKKRNKINVSVRATKVRNGTTTTTSSCRPAKQGGNKSHEV